MTAELDMAIGTPLGDAVAKLVVAAGRDQPTVLTADDAAALCACLGRRRPLADMLNGAATRKTEPAREDHQEDVAARLVPKWSQPQTGPVGEARARVAAAVTRIIGGPPEGAPELIRLAVRIVDSPELAALVDAVRADEREHVAKAIDRAKDGGHRAEPYAAHYDAGVFTAALIARAAR